MKNQEAWIPILNPTLRSAAMDAVAAIANQSWIDAQASTDLHLNSDRALFLMYYGIALSEDLWQERAIALLERVASELGSTPALPRISLYGGLSGIAWVLDHALKQTPEAVSPDDDVQLASEEDALAEIDELVFRRLITNRDSGHFDLISGWVGIGVYAQERWPRGKSRQIIEVILKRLETDAHLNGLGVTWLTGPSRMTSPAEGSQFASGYYNLGVAHGIPGVIYLLACLAQIPDYRDRVAYLQVHATRWLLNTTNPPGVLTRFTGWYLPGTRGNHSRLAWCYGDLGIAAILYGSTLIREDASIRDYAVALLSRCLAVDGLQLSVKDAGLCHGASGIAHIISRVWQNERDPFLSNVANHWYARALEMRQAGYGCGGFTAYTAKRWESTSNCSFLEGAVGIGLALLAGMFPVEPMWDRLLLLSHKSLMAPALI